MNQEPISCMTENDLREAAKLLRKLVRKGEATLVQANRLADIERALRRINAVQFGRAW